MDFNSAVEVSYLTGIGQTQLYGVLEMNECCPSLSQASRLKEYIQEGKPDENDTRLLTFGLKRNIFSKASDLSAREFMDKSL